MRPGAPGRRRPPASGGASPPGPASGSTGGPAGVAERGPGRASAPRPLRLGSGVALRNRHLGDQLRRSRGLLRLLQQPAGRTYSRSSPPAAWASPAAPRPEVGLDRVQPPVAVPLQGLDHLGPGEGPAAQEGRLPAGRVPGRARTRRCSGRMTLLDVHVHHPAPEQGVGLIHRGLVPAVVDVPGHAHVGLSTASTIRATSCGLPL